MQDKQFIIDKALNVYHNNIGWIIPDENTIKLIQSFIKEGTKGIKQKPYKTKSGIIHTAEKSRTKYIV